MTDKMTPQAALDRLETLYNQSVANLRNAVKRFLETGERADPEARAAGLFAYPRLTVSCSEIARRTSRHGPSPACRAPASIRRPSPAPTCIATICWSS